MKKQEKIKKYGYVYDVCSGFQFDLNTVLKPVANKFCEGDYCDHNCTHDCGNYNCPAAFTYNKNIDLKSVASLDKITEALINAMVGLKEMNRVFLKNYFNDFANQHDIDKKTADEIKMALEPGKLEVNLFGGNPELHPHFLDIIPIAKKMDWKTTTTTTGKKFLYDENFLERFSVNPPDLIACSADDFGGIDELKEILDMTLADIKRFWQKANPLYGQRKKAYESVYLAKLTQNKKFCPMMFNVVVHPGNLEVINNILDLLKQHFPNIKINPYPAQASFGYSIVDWEVDRLNLLEEFIDMMIDNQITGAKTEINNFVPRLPYWLVLKSVFLTAKNKSEIISLISGNNIWQCYRNFGAGRYLQAGKIEKIETKKFIPGGHPGCFWNNKTITDSRQIWNLTAEEIAKYILFTKTSMGQKAPCPCPGCIMPRLMFDGISIELGLNPKLRPQYLNLRKKYFDF